MYKLTILSVFLIPLAFAISLDVLNDPKCFLKTECIHNHINELQKANKLMNDLLNNKKVYTLTALHDMRRVLIIVDDFLRPLEYHVLLFFKKIQENYVYPSEAVHEIMRDMIFEGGDVKQFLNLLKEEVTLMKNIRNTAYELQKIYCVQPKERDIKFIEILKNIGTVDFLVANTWHHLQRVELGVNDMQVKMNPSSNGERYYYGI